MPSATELIRMASANRAAKQYAYTSARQTLPITRARQPERAEAPPPPPQPPSPPAGRLALMRTPPGMPKRGGPLAEVMRKHDIASRANISKSPHT